MFFSLFKLFGAFLWLVGLRLIRKELLEGFLGLLYVLGSLEVAWYVGGFSSFLVVQSFMVAEFVGAIIVLEEAQKAGYRQLWLECDSSIVCSPFSSNSLVPWTLRNRWNKGFSFCRGIDYKISHIFREGNHCVDKLTSLGLLNRLEFV